MRLFAFLCLFTLPAFAKPNVLFFLADDLGWADLGCYGSTYHETPHLDRLAREGLRFTHAYSAASLCSPTRASIMTGKHPVRVNITDWIPGAGDKGKKLKTPQDRHFLPLEEHTIAEAFKEAGYATYYTGKWHLGGAEHNPRKQGFDTYVQTVERTVAANGSSKKTRIPVPEGERLHLTQFMTRETVKFLKGQSAKQPFFAFVSYHDVHTPIHPDRRFIGHYQEKANTLPKSPPIPEHQGKSRSVQNNPGYASMVQAVDQSVGDILKALAEAQLAENTIVVFTSDNGGLCTLKNAGPACNLPLRAGKGWLYEGGIRIPLLIRIPGRVKPAAVTDYPVTTTDFYPTLLSLAGLEAKPAQHVDATDLSALVLDPATSLPAREICWHFPHYHGSTWTPGAAIRAGNWKLIEFYHFGGYELYDLSSDPGERNDLSKANPSKARQLLKKLHRWQKKLNAQLPVPR